jgi:hypothetical protein
MNPAADVTSMPVPSLIAVGLVAVIGLLLWAAGGKALKVTFAGLGLLIGAGLGYLLGGWVKTGLPPWSIAAVVAVLAACLGLLVYRVAVAVALGLSLAVAVPLVVWGAFEWRAMPQAAQRTELESLPGAHSDPAATAPFDDNTASPIEEIKQRLDAMKDSLSASADLDQPVQEHLDRVQQFLDSLIDRALAVWSKAPEALRPFLILASCIGFVLGLLLGSLAPSFSTSFVTATGGSLIWLAAGNVLVGETALAETAWLPRSPVAWISWWAIGTIIGLAIQWTTRGRRADKPE